MPSFSTVTDTVKAAAREAGFELVGVAGIGEFPELAVFPEWIEQGRAGEMKYLEARDTEGRLKRGSVRHIAPWARSLIVCATNYNTAEPYSTESADPARGWISRYAWSQQDYHDVVLKRLRTVEDKLLSLVHSSRSPDNEGARHDDHSLVVYEMAGFVGAEADQATATVFMFVLGSALGESATVGLRRRLSRDGGNAEELIRDAVVRASEIGMRFPRLRARLEGGPAVGYAAAPDKSFEFGLQAIFDGLEARLAAGRTSSSEKMTRSCEPSASTTTP